MSSPNAGECCSEEMQPGLGAIASWKDSFEFLSRLAPLNLLGLPIADCRLPIGRPEANRQSEIENRQLGGSWVGNTCLGVLLALGMGMSAAPAATLTGSFASIPRNSV